MSNVKKTTRATPNPRLKAERELRGWSQKYVAEHIEADDYYLSRWERGTAFPSPYYRSKLCTLFGLSAKDLGLVPATSSTSIQEEVSSQQIPVARRPEVALLDPAVPAPTLRTEELVGRGDLLTYLRERIYAGKGLVLTALHGLPGVGKTTLAVALAHDHEVLTHFPDGILWVGLGPHPNTQASLSRWGALLGITEAESAELTNIEDWTQAIHAIIGARRLLLVIDDAWKIDDALTFKIGGPNCAYLVTTRYPQLALLFTADGTTMIEELSEADAIFLLTRLAPELASSDPAVVQELVRSVGGLPLALMLMGKYLHAQAHSGQPRRLRNAIERLRNTEERLRLMAPQALLERSPSTQENSVISLNAIIEVGVQLLAQQTRYTLYALAAFPAKPSSFSEEAALAVGAMPVEVLDELNDAGLLESRGAGRYTLHQTIADYAKAHLKDPATYIRLSTYFASFVQEHEKDYDALEIESSNIAVALEAAATHGLHAEFVRCVNGFSHFLEARGLNAQAETYLKIAEAMAIASNDLVGLTTIYYKLGRFVSKRGEYAQEDRYLQQALELARQTADCVQMSTVLKALGAMAGERGDTSQARIYLEEGLVLAREAGEAELIGTLLLNLGQIASDRGDFEDAETLLQEGLALARTVGHREEISLLLSNLGVLAGRQRNFVQAEKYLREGLALARPIGHRERISLLLVNLGWVVCELGMDKEGNGYIQEALDIARQIGNQWLISGILGAWGQIYLSQQRFKEAWPLFHEMYTMTNGSANQGALGQALYALAQIAAARGDLSLARQQGQESLTIYEAIGDRDTREVREWLARL